MDPALLAQFTHRNRANRRRAEELTGIFRESRSLAERHARLWPNLRWISCWADGQASPYASQLASLFPQARMQGKGLIATEGFVSLPLAGREGAALAYRSHFFEFLPEGEDPPRLAHALERGARYSLAITTGGGLYRYQLHDLVECTGFYRGCPLLRFIGRVDRVSDWFGEKLNALYVERALAAALGEDPLPAAFTMLACEADLAPPGYALFIEAPGRSEEALRAIAREIEQALLLNFHYRYCRDLGQLAPLRVFRIAEGGAETYLRACREKGLREGNIKPTALHKDSGWSRLFRGSFVHPPESPGEPARESVAGCR